MKARAEHDLRVPPSRLEAGPEDVAVPVEQQVQTGAGAHLHQGKRPSCPLGDSGKARQQRRAATHLVRLHHVRAYEALELGATVETPGAEGRVGLGPEHRDGIAAVAQ